MTLVATILYEDSRADARGARASPFVPHQLVVWCVGDRIGKPGWELRDAFDDIPLNGAGNIKRVLALGSVGSKGEQVFAVFDRDKISDQYPSCGSCLSTTGTAIRRHVVADLGARFIPVLLEQNMETIVSACRSATGAAALARKPKPAQRDRVIGKTLGRSQASQRAHVLEAVPSLDYLVTKLANLL